MNQNCYLSVSFLQSHGISVPKPLKDWIARARYLQNSISAVAQKERYEMWALCLIEEAARTPGGTATTEWSKVPTVMPANAALRTPDLLARNSSSAGMQGVARETSDPLRNALFNETISRAPGQLRPYVIQAFELYDQDVARGKRTYAQVSFMEMLNIAKGLLSRHALTSQAQRAQTNAQPAANMVPRKTPASPVVEEPREKRLKIADNNPYKEEIRFFFSLSGRSTEGETSSHAFVGRSSELERQYTRYEPLVDDIRPAPVLEKAFSYIQKRCSEIAASDGEKAAKKYLSDQLKGMRQDLRVQNIATLFTVAVYEFHARLCLEIGDIGEFNQCQAGLKQFYLIDSIDVAQCSMAEFFLYRLVYLTLSEQHDSLSTELITYTIAAGKHSSRMGRCIVKADVTRTLALCAACSNGDTSSICRLLTTFPIEMTYLVRIYLQKLRIMWIKVILTALKGALTMRFLMSSLGFTPVKGCEDGSRSVSFWLDGTEEAAQTQMEELFKVLKLQFPVTFSFKSEVSRAKRSGKSSKVQQYPSIDAAVALKAVDEYILFLGTRKDSSVK